jgi:hypothetical protein
MGLRSAGLGCWPSARRALASSRRLTPSRLLTALRRIRHSQSAHRQVEASARGGACVAAALCSSAARNGKARLHRRAARMPSSASVCRGRRGREHVSPMRTAKGAAPENRRRQERRLAGAGAAPRATHWAARRMGERAAGSAKVGRGNWQATPQGTASAGSLARRRRLPREIRGRGAGAAPATQGHGSRAA